MEGGLEVSDRLPDPSNGGSAAAAPDEKKKAPICTVTFCPVCTVVTALGDARPDIVEHMMSAARETLLAMQALVEVRLNGAEPSARPGRVERITID